MMIHKTYRILLILLVITAIVGAFCEYQYKHSYDNVIPVNEFQIAMNKKIKVAENESELLIQTINYHGIEAISNYKFPDNDINYYIYKNNELIFWTDNQNSLNDIHLNVFDKWEYIPLSNVLCISHIQKLDSFTILSLIKVKNNYPNENIYLKNKFAKDLEIDEEIQISEGKASDKYAIFSSDNHYLFTLSDNEHVVLNEYWAYASLLFYFIAILIFLFCYANFQKFSKSGKISIVQFVVSTVFVSIILGLSLFFDIPELLYWNEIFSPIQYASNPFLASISHLSIATLFFLSFAYLLYFNVSFGINWNRMYAILLQILFVSCFVLFYNLLKGLVFHSSFQINLLNFKDLSLIAVWIHFLVLIWGITLSFLFYKIHNWLVKNGLIKFSLITDTFLVLIIVVLTAYFSKEDLLQLPLSLIAILFVYYIPYLSKKWININVIMVIWLLFYVSFFVINSVKFYEDKNFEKYKVLAENIQINGTSENDDMADILLDELDLQIIKDVELYKLSLKSDSALIANQYLNETYFRGFWNKYDMRLNIVQLNSQLYNQYKTIIDLSGTRIYTTHFYRIPASLSTFTYIGEFKNFISKDSMYLFFEFFPRKNFRSYSFPNLFVSGSSNTQTQLDINVANYKNNKLVYSTGNENFLLNNDWMAKSKLKFYYTFINNKRYFIYNENADNQLIITSKHTYNNRAYLIYFSYIFISYYTICWILLLVYKHNREKTKFRLGLIAKFQYLFISLLVFSFLGILYVSVNYIRKKYQNEQVSRTETKKDYVQKALQELYYWNQDLSSVNQQTLNFDLQELSHRYQTDILVFDNRGMLVGSSQPLIFNKNLVSKRISPEPYFSEKPNITQYENIGELKYLTSYTDFYNGDYLPIGFIAIPQFLSQEEIKSEIEDFLSTIIQIYLIIILLAIFLSVFIGRQLSIPLNLIENKLKEMQFGHKNEKIEYKQNDEISQLVAQYNKTVDELEKSAQLLAMSERESAWKTMARQIAHEINNPLTPMKLTIQQLQRTKKSGDESFDDYFEKSAKTLIEQIDNLSHIAGAFSNFARLPEAKFKITDVADKLRSVVQLFAHNNDNVSINFIGSQNGIYVFADSEQLVQVFNNLLKNALQAINSTQEGRIDVQIVTSVEKVIIKITDNGCGISEEIQDKLFVPNFTTKNTGMGLGLAIAKNIITISNGSISFSSTKNIGTEFKITLPLAIENP